MQPDRLGCRDLDTLGRCEKRKKDPMTEFDLMIVATDVTWKQVNETLDGAAENVRFVFIPVDPERDTPQRWWLTQHRPLWSVPGDGGC
jgi:hypothetical protein